jgi:hypothetical protein
VRDSVYFKPSSLTHTLGFGKMARLRVLDSSSIRKDLFFMVISIVTSFLGLLLWMTRRL